MMPKNAKYAKTLRKEYIKDILQPREVETLAKNLNDIESTQTSYYGRVILELLQNMDDQGYDGASLHGLIKIIGNNLIVCNQGKPFNEEGIKSVHESHLSSKITGDSIGNKGLGFRSLLNFADKIQIFSGDFAMQFSEQFAKKYFDKIKNNKQIKKSIKMRGAKETYLPMLSVPESIDYAAERQPNGKFRIDGCEYDTYMKIHLKDDNAIAKIENQIKTFIREENVSLLFLHHLKSVNLSCNDISATCCVEDIPCSGIPANINITKRKISQTASDNDNKDTQYFVRKKDTGNGNIAIAVPEHIEHNANYNLYSFFPMNKEPSEFQVYLHADNFDMISNRDTLTGKEENAQILSNLLYLLLDTAYYFAKPEYGTIAMDMLYHSKLPGVLVKHIDNFENDFYAELRKAPIILTLQNTYISLNDNPKVLPTEFDDCENVFKCIDNTISQDVADKLPDELRSDVCEFTAQSLYNEINKISYQFDSDTRALLFYDWKAFVKGKSNLNLMPKILKNTNGEFFTYDTEEHDKISLTTTDMDIKDIPQWANHNVVAKSDIYALRDHIKKLPYLNPAESVLTREIRRNYPNDFYADDISDLLTSIGSKINQDYQRSIDFVIFLLKNHTNSTRWNEKRTKFPFPAIHNNVVMPADKLYFGPTYENPKAELCKLFGLTEFIPLDKLRTYIDFDITDEQIVNLLNKNYYINEQPKLIEINDLDNPDVINIKKYYQNKIFETNDTVEITRLSPINIKHITNIENALNNIQNQNDTAQLLSYLEKLSEHIKKDTNYSIQANIKINQNGRGRPATEFVTASDNYDRFLLCTKKWIIIDSEKYAPRELLLKSSNNNLKSVPSEWAMRYNELLKNIGVKSNIWEMDDDVFYEILLKLPNFDESGTISKSIYNNLSNNYSTYNTSNCSQKQEFLTHGKLFARNKNNSAFVDVKHVQFASSKPVNQGNIWLIDKNYRTGSAEEFKKIFGIDKFEETINITNVVLHKTAQHIFNKLWKDFEPFVEIYTIKHTKLKDALENLQIEILSYAENNGQAIQDAADYDLLPGQNQKQWYIFLPEQKSLNQTDLALTIGNLFNILENSAEKVSSEITLLFQLSEAHRWKHLENMGFDTSEHRDCSVIRESFINAIGGNLDDDDINSINFSNINSEDSVTKIIAILHKYGMTYADIKNNGFKYDIRFNAYHTRKLKDKFGSTENAYKNQRYLELKTAAPEQQQNFFDDINARGQNITVTESDIDCDYGKYCPDLPITDDAQCVDINTIFNNNKKIFLATHPTISEDDMDSMGTTEKSMLLFEQYDTLAQQISARIKQDAAKKEEAKSKKIATLTYTLDTANASIVAVNPSAEFTDVDNPTGKRVKHATISGQKLAQQRAKSGEDAEEAVYNMLIASSEYTNIDWVSCIGYKKGKGTVNNDSLGYDMTYVHENKQYFAEIKSVSVNGDNYEFIVSANETKVAQEKLKHNERYVFILVTPEHTIMPIHDENTIVGILDKGVPDSLKCAIIKTPKPTIQGIE